MESPKWKKIKGDEHIQNNQSIGSDLLALEEYANQMLEQGWRLIRLNGEFQFTFVPCAPGEYICRTAITVTKNGFYDKQAATALSDLLVSDGALIVEQRNTLGSRIGVIALRPAALGPFEITSDLDSRIAEYQARKKYVEGAGITFIVIAIAYIPLAISLELGAFYAIAACFFAVGINYMRPVKRYKEIIAQLQEERGVSEG